MTRAPAFLALLPLLSGCAALDVVDRAAQVIEAAAPDVPGDLYITGDLAALTVWEGGEQANVVEVIGDRLCIRVELPARPTAFAEFLGPVVHVWDADDEVHVLDLTQVDDLPGVAPGCRLEIARRPETWGAYRGTR